MRKLLLAMDRLSSYVIYIFNVGICDQVSLLILPLTLFLTLTIRCTCEHNYRLSQVSDHRTYIMVFFMLLLFSHFSGGQNKNITNCTLCAGLKKTFAGLTFRRWFMEDFAGLKFHGFRRWMIFLRISRILIFKDFTDFWKPGQIMFREILCQRKFISCKIYTQGS